jgi:hypothetical protein
VIDAFEDRHALGLQNVFEPVGGNADRMGAFDAYHAFVCGRGGRQQGQQRDGR